MQPPENHVAMMQIDCEVMNTRLLHIHQDSIPAHASHTMRADYSKSKRVVYKSSLKPFQNKKGQKNLRYPTKKQPSSL